MLTFLFSANAQATKIDVYRDLLLKNSYTIRYENITPPPRITNADRIELYGKSGLAVESNDYIHWYFSDYTDMHGAAQIQLLAAGKTQILNTMLGKMTAIAHTKVGLAFGGAKVTEDLKQELFSLLKIMLDKL